MESLIAHLESMALAHGATLKHSSTFHPMAIEHNAKTDFSRGVLATISEVYRLASQAPDGRKAICDLGFQPFPHHQESRLMEAPLTIQVIADTSEVREAIDLFQRLPAGVRDSLHHRIADLPHLGFYVGKGDFPPATKAGDLPLRYSFPVRVLWLEEVRSATARATEAGLG